MTRHVATPAGVRYYHKPIGTPLGGSSARSVEKVTLAGATSASAFAQAVSGAAPYRPYAPYQPKKTLFAGKSNPAGLPGVFPGGTAAAPIPAEVKPAVHDVANFWNHHMSDADKEGLSSDLGLDPSFAKHSIRELRKAIKDRNTDPAKREAMKAELTKRITLAKEVSAETQAWGHRLTTALSEKPADADLAPIIGETLAAHPRLGPLAHIWDRLRLSGYNFKKKFRAGEFTDELPRIIARNAAAVLLAGLMLHFGVFIPGLGSGG